MRWWDIDVLLPTERELFAASAWSAEMFWSELAQYRSRYYLVAEAAGCGGDSPAGTAGPGQAAVLGYAGVMVSGSQADVQTIAVVPAAQGRGVGGLLLRALIERALRCGVNTLLLEVRADNAPAIGLYRRHGFEQIAVRRGYYQPSGVDALVMRRRPLRVPGVAGPIGPGSG
jgi:ribosomal-protein-alanine N-acetyltransferase